MRHANIGTISALAVLGLTRGAEGDVPPPDDYIETCTMDRQQQQGESCILCPVTFEDSDACTRGCGPLGYTKRCQTWGAAAYEEVLCRSTSSPSQGECTRVNTAQPLTDEGSGEPGSAGDPGVGYPTGGTGGPGIGGTAGYDKPGGPAICRCIEDATPPQPDQPGCSCSIPEQTGSAETLAATLAALALGLRRRRACRPAAA